MPQPRRITCVMPLVWPGRIEPAGTGVGARIAAKLATRQKRTYIVTACGIRARKWSNRKGSRICTNRTNAAWSVKTIGANDRVLAEQQIAARGARQHQGPESGAVEAERVHQHLRNREQRRRHRSERDEGPKLRRRPKRARQRHRAENDDHDDGRHHHDLRLGSAQERAQAGDRDRRRLLRETRHAAFDERDAVRGDRRLGARFSRDELPGVHADRRQVRTPQAGGGRSATGRWWRSATARPGPRSPPSPHREASRSAPPHS